MSRVTEDSSASSDHQEILERRGTEDFQESKDCLVQRETRCEATPPQGLRIKHNIVVSISSNVFFCDCFRVQLAQQVPLDPPAPPACL